ncbi:hypothetical protein BJX61DRAFT_546553 [Aspergillus egyptiacus]|nr:hypothetical protein BJX61DRAFT_546553 [Aspergillus egyptiacus]
MAPTISKPARRKVRKGYSRHKRHRIEKRSSPKSPRTLLGPTQTRSLAKRGKLLGSGRGLSVTPKPSPVESKPSPRIIKYKIATQWPSSEPYEKNCLQREPLLDNYVFVPRGDVYLTRNCRSQTKESHRLVYKVYDNAGKRTLGIRVPSDVYSAVMRTAEETAESRAEAVKTRDQKDLARSRQILCTQFPLMPAETLDMILDHAFLKGSGRVGRTSTTSDEHKATLAVEAHIRHKHTPYETLLREGRSREEARKGVWETVRAIRDAWKGHGSPKPAVLTLRSRTSSLSSAAP